MTFDVLRSLPRTGALAWTRAFVVLAVLALVWGCAEEKTPAEPLVGGCVGCHTDEERLMATAEPDTAEVPEEPGEG